MDTLLLTQNFVLVMEIKNIVGRVEYMKEKHQFIRIHADGKIDGFRNPFDQVKRHARFLRKLLDEQGYSIPIYYFVVAANPSMVMSSSLFSQPILHVSGLVERIDQLLKQSAPTYLNEHELSELAAYIVKMQKPSSWSPPLAWHEIKKGALCVHCQYAHILRYTYGKWRCEHCQKVDNQAFLTALQDYRLLQGDEISNAQFCDFFNISSKKTAYYLLQKLKFEIVGSNKSRKYIIPTH